MEHFYHFVEIRLLEFKLCSCRISSSLLKQIFVTELYNYPEKVIVTGIRIPEQYFLDTAFLYTGRFSYLLLHMLSLKKKLPTTAL